MKDQAAKSPKQPEHSLRLAGRIAHGFIDSKLTPLVIVAALLLGAFSILETPREEEPQIVVPMLDVFVQMPGASPEEISQRVSLPMEKLLREVPGVEYVYSISQPGMSMLIVRFYVGSKEEDAIIQTYNKLCSNFDRIPPGVSQPIIKVRSINDVPIMALTLWGKNYDPYQLRHIAGELENSQTDRRCFRNVDHRRPAAAGTSGFGYRAFGRLWTHARGSGESTPEREQSW
jgi:multidrug efflux pump subunit AcrB